MPDRQIPAENIISPIPDFRVFVLEAGKSFVLTERLSKLQQEASAALGIPVPELTLRENPALQPHQFIFKVREVEVRRGDTPEQLVRELGNVISQYSYEFLGIAEVEKLLNHLRLTKPALVQAIYPALMSLNEIHRVLQNLLREGIPIRDLEKILETLAEYAPAVQPPDLLTEFVRHAMARLIGSIYQEGSAIKGFLLDAEIEQWINGAIRWEEGPVLDLDAQKLDQILHAITKKIYPYLLKRKKPPVLFVSADIRRFVRLLIESIAPAIPVLSIGEISQEYQIKVLGLVRLETWTDRLIKFIFPFKKSQKKPESAAAPNWKAHFEQAKYAKAEETGPREKAAIFIASAARWVQDDVYRHLSEDELRKLGQGMLQFPFISSAGKRKAWDDSENILFKDEWWDSETLTKFVQASLKGELEEFKKRGFRRGQKLALLLLSLPASAVHSVGGEVLNHFPKPVLQQILMEIAQWREQLPPEARQAAIQDFLTYVENRQVSDFQFSQSQLTVEVERIILRNSKEAAALVKYLWMVTRDMWSVFEAMSLQMPKKLTGWLVAYFKSTAVETEIPPEKKASYFVASLPLIAAKKLKDHFSAQEKKSLGMAAPPSGSAAPLFRKFIKAYYGQNVLNMPIMTKLN